MSDLEKSDEFSKTEKRLLELKKKLEHRIDRTEGALEEVKKINKEIEKLRKKNQASS